MGNKENTVNHYRNIQDDKGKTAGLEKQKMKTLHLYIGNL